VPPLPGEEGLLLPVSREGVKVLSVGSLLVEGEALAPVAYDDLAAAGLLEPGLRCWQRDLPSLAKHKERLSGLAFHSPDRIEAWALWDETGTLWAAGAAPGPFGRIGLSVVLDEINAPLILPRATPEELDADLLAELGFESGPEHLLFTSQAQAA